MKANPLILCIDRFDAPNGNVWAVRSAGKWRTARTVNVSVPLTTVFRGIDSRQPKAYLEGRGVVRSQAGTITITAQ